MLERIDDKSLAEAVTDRLRTAIFEGVYDPGTRLVERKLAAELGISHIPVREALTRLAEEGLVVRLPRRGARVVQLDERTVDEISDIRRLLEGFVAVRTQERMTVAAEAGLRGLVSEMRAAAAAGDVRAMLELDIAFQEHLWALADHRLLNELAAQLRGRINRFLLLAGQSLSKTALRAQARSHAKIVDAIARDDPDAARAAMEAHIDGETARIKNWMRR